MHWFLQKVHTEAQISFHVNFTSSRHVMQLESPYSNYSCKSGGRLHANGETTLAELWTEYLLGDHTEELKGMGSLQGFSFRFHWLQLHSHGTVFPGLQSADFTHLKVDILHGVDFLLVHTVRGFGFPRLFIMTGYYRSCERQAKLPTISVRFKRVYALTKQAFFYVCRATKFYTQTEHGVQTIRGKTLFLAEICFCGLYTMCRLQSGRYGT